MTETTPTTTNLRIKGTGLARIDKWLRAARTFKARALAADACKNNHMDINGMNVRSSHVIKPGETIDVKKSPITYSFKMVRTIEQRVRAKSIPQIYENITDAKQYELLEMSRINGFVDRVRGTGRPTKKGRHSMDTFVRPTLSGQDEEDEWDGEDNDNQQ